MDKDGIDNLLVGEVQAEDIPILKPILHTSKKFYMVVSILVVIILIGIVAWFLQLRSGLGITGLNHPIFWGVYITNFVFFIGISHAGTLISAILRLTRAEWRRAITRSAEVITVLVLFFGLIPDIALMRDKLKSKTKGFFYKILALNWKGTEKQWKILERAIAIMAVVVIPIAVSVHTVVSYVFAMTIQPMWHSTIFGPYFVTGAIFSGIAALLIAMYFIRRSYHLEDYLKPIHFNNLGLLLLVMSLLWFYFTFTENLTAFYGADPAHLTVFWSKFTGVYAPYFWTMVGCCFVIPLIILSNRRTRTVTGTMVASISVIVGMWLERFTIVLPTLINPRLPYQTGSYHPTWIEFAITAGCFATFILLYILFTKFFPIISIWEVKEGREVGVKETEERIKSYLPGKE
jgi:molybdopterin-containing oxidoreductase family membrane subunit